MSNAPLVRFFKRAGVVSGPSRKQTRHSDLSVIKTWLIGDPVSFAYKAHNNFGSAVHSAWLLNKLGNWKLNEEETRNRAGMLAALEKHSIATKLLSGCNVREKRRVLKLNGVPFGFTPDAHGKQYIVDLKTTICATREAFIESAFKYGYFRQGVTYMACLRMKQFYIVGIQKQFPFNVYIVWLQSSEFKDWVDYATEELKFLLYFYQNYGAPNYKRH